MDAPHRPAPAASSRLGRIAFAGGVLTIVAGFLYGAVFAGIPYQDPTPEMAANWRFHTAVGDRVMAAGAVLALAGAASWVAGAVWRAVRPPGGSG